MTTTIPVITPNNSVSYKLITDNFAIYNLESYLDLPLKKIVAYTNTWPISL